MRCDELNSSETILTQEAATHLVVHHSHLGLLALGSLPIGLGRSLGLISTGHDYWVEREEKKHGERVSCDKSNLFWWRIEEIKDTLEIYVYFVSLPLACFLLCALPVCVYDAYAEPHSECVWLGVRLSFLYAGAHGRGIMAGETNLLRSEARDKRNPTSSQRDVQRRIHRGWGTDWRPVTDRNITALLVQVF